MGRIEEALHARMSLFCLALTVAQDEPGHRTVSSRFQTQPVVPDGVTAMAKIIARAGIEPP